MKKIAKLSLVTAVMVAGLTNVNAASLEEAIKNVDVSGQFRFRFQEKKIDGATTGNETNSDVEVEIGVKVPVNDMVTAVFKIDNAGNHADNSPSGKGDVEIEDYYFSYANDGLTVNAGQQNIPGRLTDANQGDGVVVLKNMGDFTVGAAAFANHNVDVSGLGSTYNGSQALYSVIALGNIGPVSLLGQYATVQDTVDTYGVKADASIEMVKLGLEYTSSDIHGETGVAPSAQDDRSTLKAYVSGKAGIVSAKLSYAKTGDNGSGSIDSQVNNDGLEAASEWLMWNLGTSNNADMDVVALDASVALTDKVSLRAAYATGEIGSATGSDVDETLAQVTYKMSKNLTSYVRYATFDKSGTSDADGQRGRVEVKYTF